MNEELLNELYRLHKKTKEHNKPTYLLLCIENTHIKTINITEEIGEIFFNKNKIIEPMPLDIKFNKTGGER